MNMAEMTKENPPVDLESARKKIHDLETFAKELEQEREVLSKSESEHRIAFEHSGTAMIVAREDMIVVMANQRVEEVCGFSKEEVNYKRRWTDFVYPEDLDRLRQYHIARRKNPASAPSEYEFRIVDRTGNIHEVLANAALIPGTTLSLISMIDITSRKNTERALRESQKRFKEIADLLPGIICEMDTSLKLTYVNKMGFTAFGFTEEDFERGIDVNDYIFPEDRERAAQDIRNVSQGDFGNAAVYRLRTKTGGTLHAIVNSSPIEKNGSLVGIRCCIIDISDRIAAETQLKESEERFKTIFEQSPIGIALFNGEGSPLDMNGAFKAMRTATEASGGSASDNLFSMHAISESEKSELAAGKGIDREVEYPSLHSHGGADTGSRWLAWRVTPLGIGENGPSSYLAMVEDITESKMAREAELKAHREAAAKAESLVAGLRYELLEKARFNSMVSRSPQMREIFDILPEIANASAHALICGESGTGKELVAKSLHELSARNRRAFVAINCGALPDTLLESELFGYRAGAFTDAKKDKPGKFTLADGGTIFFDEIGDISAAMQVKLLRVLQEKTFEPLGGTATQHADVRVIAATNRDLTDMVRKGTFREDLYYRINVVAIKLPPLRERRCDIPLLCDHFIERFNARYGKSVKGISPEATEVILAYEYPGNIRELENAIEHAFVFCKTPMIEPRHLPAVMRAAREPSEGEVLSNVNDFDDLERMYINAILKESGGSRIQAAKRLGVHKATLFRKLKKLGIQ
jgi:PAS domain S-box-containing protein